MKKIFLCLLVSFGALNANAENAWYWGEVTQLNTLGPDGSFEVRINHPDLISICTYNNVRFKAADMGSERTKAALSMALAAFMGGKKFGVVLDLPSSAMICEASPTASQGAGIK